MTQEEELAEIIEHTYHVSDGCRYIDNHLVIAKAILAAGFVKVEKVWEGEPQDAHESIAGAGVKASIWGEVKHAKRIQVFVRQTE